MSQLKRNVFANFVGRAWTNILSVLFIPLYLRFLGIESFGLIGFFITLRSVLGLMDMGLGMSLNREMARLSAKRAAQKQRDLLRTLETIYWSMSILIAFLVFALAPIIANHWVNPEHLPIATVTRAVWLMGFVIALQFPFSFYQGGLMGLQRQVLVNAILGITGTLRGLGAVLILWWISPSIIAFFCWQIVVSAVQTGTTAILVWRSLPCSGKRPSFKKGVLIEVWYFAAGVSGNAIVGAALRQLDKIILSKMLSLEIFGYYTLAWTVASFLWSIILPVNSALFPRFTELFELRKELQLTNLYHRACQLLAVLLLPTAVTIAFSSYDIMLLWTRNAGTAEKTYLILAILAFGTGINGVASIPISLQFASGWPQLTMYTNLISAALLVPGIVCMVNYYGATGAAIIWLALNGVYVLFTVPIMHRRLLKKEKWRWYLEDIAPPSIGALVVGCIARVLAPQQMSWAFAGLYILATWLVSVLVCTSVTSQARAWVIANIWPTLRAYLGRAEVI